MCRTGTRYIFRTGTGAMYYWNRLCVEQDQDICKTGAYIFRTGTGYMWNRNRLYVEQGQVICRAGTIYMQYRNRIICKTGTGYIYKKDRLKTEKDKEKYKGRTKNM